MFNGYIFSFLLGLCTGYLSNVLYNYIHMITIKSSLSDLGKWIIDGEDIYYSKNSDFKITSTLEEKFNFYTRTENGIELIPFNFLQRDTFLKKEIWDYCNKGLPIEDNKYQCVTANFLKGTTKLFSVELLRIDLKHYPRLGEFNHYYIPRKIYKSADNNETLLDSREYCICKLLCYKDSEGYTNNDEILDFLDWKYINNN